jgi:predicted methyltransferase
MKKDPDSSLIFYYKSPTSGATYFTDHDGNLYYEKDSEKYKLSIFDSHLYKLRVYEGIPVLEIDGLRMQLLKDFKNPLEYASLVASSLTIPAKGNFSALDTCMGLGYTSTALSKNPSISKITTIELSDAVYKLASFNPYSEELFKKGSKIEILRGDSFELIKTFPDSCFDFIIHDPPRYSHAPLLYSNEFYSQLFRVSKPNATLFHYVGSIGKFSGRDIVKEAQNRLISCGFASFVIDKKLQGLIFKKPSL